ncbi:MAG: hypothetical protein BIFFINMI_03168 [Phycisphaerae bacterium]|nr:hypothetical protein [Phycisphaerae bacterium]
MSHRKMRVGVATIGLMLLGLALSAGPAWALDIPITVAEPIGLARKAAPVSCGIPLPGGQFKADQAFSLFDGEAETPLQALPLVVDEKGFLRWVLLDFQADLAAGQTRTFTLKTEKGAAAPAKALKVTDAADGVTVDTGKASFAIARNKPFALFDSAAAGGRQVVAGGTATYTDGFDGKQYVADKPDSVEVNYAGPLRTTISVKGHFVGDANNRFQYIARITAWAGHSDVLVKYSLANSNPDHYCYRQVSDSTVTLKLANAPAGAILGTSKALEADGPAWMQQSERAVVAACHHNDALGSAAWAQKAPAASAPGGCKAMAGEKELWTSQGKGDQSQGWIAAKAGAGTVFVTDLYFVEDPPRKLAVTAEGLALVGVTTPLEGAQLPFAEPIRWLFDCSHLSSQYVIDFAAEDPATMSALARAARGRLWGMAPPAWYFQTEQLPVGHFGTQADELKCYDLWDWKYDKSKVPTGPVDQMARIGRWTYADDNHFTSEQDTADGLLLMYLRTGDRGFFDATESWIHYFEDLQTWRTDGWRWKDGGVWWHGGPAGNRPQRAPDPVTGLRNSLPAEWTKSVKTPLGEWGLARCRQISSLFLAKACHCHNWGEGLAEWFMLTGDRDAYEAAIDTVEQNVDTQVRAFGKAPGKANSYSRDFTRSCYLTNATRMIAPTDEFVVKSSDELAAAFLGRAGREVRGLVNGPHSMSLSAAELKKLVGQQGIDEMNRLGVSCNPKTGELTDPKTGAKWYPIAGITTWMYPPLSRAMELYYRLTGNEDAMDWVVAYGQAAARVMYQPRHGQLHASILADFPAKGVVKDVASWTLPPDSKDGDGMSISGYLAQFYPDVAMRGYTFAGEEICKQRAYDYWYYGSHRGYQATKLSNIGGVGMWVNVYTTHGESVCFTGDTFYQFAHPRSDEKAPAAVDDLRVTLAGDKATVSFTAPADAGGGKVVRYQLKCSDKPIVDYATFLDKYAANQDAALTNWWMAANLAGEPAPQAAGAKVSFQVSGVPEGAKYFALRTFDDSSNRSAIGNVVQAGD